MNNNSERVLWYLQYILMHLKMHTVFKNFQETGLHHKHIQKLKYVYCNLKFHQTQFFCCCLRGKPKDYSPGKTSSTVGVYHVMYAVFIQFRHLNLWTQSHPCHTQASTVHPSPTHSFNTFSFLGCQGSSHCCSQETPTLSSQGPASTDTHTDTHLPT